MASIFVFVLGVYQNGCYSIRGVIRAHMKGNTCSRQSDYQLMCMLTGTDSSLEEPTSGSYASCLHMEAPRSSLVPSLSNPQIFIACSMENRGRKPRRVSHVKRATDVTTLFVYRADMSLGGVYTVTSLFCYLPAVRPRMRERTVLRTYEGGELYQRCMLLAGTTLTGPSPLQSALCVWLEVSFHLLLPVLVRKKVSSCRLSTLIGFATHLNLEYSNCCRK